MLMLLRLMQQRLAPQPQLLLQLLPRALLCQVALPSRALHLLQHLQQSQPALLTQQGHLLTRAQCPLLLLLQAALRHRMLTRAQCPLLLLLLLLPQAALRHRMLRQSAPQEGAPHQQQLLGQRRQQRLQQWLWRLRRRVLAQRVLLLPAPCVLPHQSAHRGAAPHHRQLQLR
jgi:hypothetical protein